MQCQCGIVSRLLNMEISVLIPFGLVDGQVCHTRVYKLSKLCLSVMYFIALYPANGHETPNTTGTLSNANYRYYT